MQDCIDTKRATRWLNRLQKLLAEMPDDIEVIAGEGRIDALPRGFYDQFGDCDRLLDLPGRIDEHRFDFIWSPPSFIPNSESI